jgi:tetratricopeptide (TPR) repeat protein
VKALFWIGEHHHDAHALRNSAYYADSALRSDNGASCNARLAKAAVLFHECKFSDALRLYASTLRSDPRAAGASARIGVGLCAYHLGDKDKALTALERALSLVAVAILRLDQESDPKIMGRKGTGLLSKRVC